MKFPLKFIRHDLRYTMRGQGKRRGGMIMGAGARTGFSLELDFKATFGLTDEQTKEAKLFNDWEFNTYRRQRENGADHDEAAGVAYEETDKEEAK